MTQYKDSEYQFVAILNQKIELPKLLNALGHMAVGLSGSDNQTSKMKFLKYMDADGTIHPAISRYPFIILRARNSNQIRTTRNMAISSGILYNDFTQTMIGVSSKDQLENTHETREIELEYFGLCLFGRKEEIRQLTKRFSLFK